MWVSHYIIFIVHGIISKYDDRNTIELNKFLNSIIDDTTDNYI